MSKKIWLAVGMIVLVGVPVSNAAVVSPSSYDMLNGVSPGSRTRHYWDREYNGTGETTVDAAELSGGLGNLADGVITDQHWNIAEAVDANPDILEPTDGIGPYVGWRRAGIAFPVEDPEITFHFANPVQFSLVRVHYEDDGADIFAPFMLDVTVGKVTKSWEFDRSERGPRWADFDVAGSGMEGDTLFMKIYHYGTWVHVDEIAFEGTVVPEPGSFCLLGLGGLALLRRARRRRA